MSQKYPITISSWTLGDQCTFEERVAAAKAAGFEGIGLRAETYVDALNEGLFDADILAVLKKYDMKVTEVEYIVQWAEEHRSYEQKYKEQMCFHSHCKEIEDIGDQLHTGASQVRDHLCNLVKSAVGGCDAEDKHDAEQGEYQRGRKAGDDLLGAHAHHVHAHDEGQGNGQDARIDLLNKCYYNTHQ